MWTQLPGEKQIALDDENLQYTGRIDFADPKTLCFSLPPRSSASA